MSRKNTTTFYATNLLAVQSELSAEPSDRGTTRLETGLSGFFSGGSFTTGNKTKPTKPITAPPLGCIL